MKRASIHFFLRRVLWAFYLLVRPLARVVLSYSWRRRLSVGIRQFVGQSANPKVSTGSATSGFGLKDLELPSGYDIIWFPIIEWEHRFQRPQQLASLFAQNGHRVFYLCLTFQDRSSHVECRRIAEHIVQVQLPGPPDLNRFFEPLPSKAQEQCQSALFELCKEARISDSILMVDLPFWTPLALGLQKRYGWKVIYDCMDEHSGLSILRPDLLQEEAKLARQADLVLVSSQKLWDKHDGQNSRQLMLRNAADFDHFNQPMADKVLTGIESPIIGYYGAIMDWFDAGMVDQAAGARPNWNFVLIGNVDTPSVEPLRQRHNVHFLGEIPYQRLPAYLRKFDVCLIPFRLTPIIQSTNPVKFYEYLSAGKPVVSVPMPELMPYPELVYPARTGQEMVVQIERALQENSPERIQERINWARQQTWQARYLTLTRAIEQLYDLASIIIVSYNNLDKIRNCLESIREKTLYSRYEVIIVDNGSVPEVVEYLRESAQSDRRIRVILNGQNLGFAHANNIGLQAISSDSRYIVLLNNDTVVTRGWLTTLVHWLGDKSVGLVGPVTGSTGAANEAAIITEYQNMDEMESFARQSISEHRGSAFDIPMLAMYCLAFRRDLYEEIGPLDERFGIGMFEDDDYSIRVRQKGYRVICAEDVFIHHDGRASFSKLSDVEYQKLFDENRRYFETKWNLKWERHSARTFKETSHGER